MQEIVSEALVLDLEDSGEADSRVFLFTGDWGKISAKATSIRKITSKLAAHLQPFNSVIVRLVFSGEKKFFSPAFQCVDALLIAKPSMRPADQFSGILQALRLIIHAIPNGVPDQELWKFLLEVHSGEADLDSSTALSFLGFGKDFAYCGVCQNRKPEFFWGPDQILLCSFCSRGLYSGSQLMRI